VLWNIIGAKSMVRINDKAVICLDIVDAGCDFAKAAQVDFTSCV
jgi:hypothetical protein